MSASDLINLIVRCAFLMVAAVSLIDWLRFRDRPRLDTALMFGALAVTILGGEAQRLLNVQVRWLAILDLMALMAHPYLLLRLVGHFLPLPPLTSRIALGGLLVAWLTITAVPSPLPLPATLGLVVYFVAVEGYATWLLLRAARQSGGILRWRTLFAAAGSGWLAAAFAMLGLALVLPAAVSLTPVFYLLALLSAISYYLGFAPPPALRRAWQLAELYRFLRQAAGRPIAERVSGTLEHLCPAVTRAIGGLGCAVITRPLESGPFSILAVDRPELPPAPPGAAEEALARAWQERQPVVARRPAEMGPDTARWAAALGAGALLAVPIASADRIWGVLAAFRFRPSPFPADDAALLQLFAEQAAEALESGELFKQQQQLVERLAWANKELEAFSYSVSHDLRAPLRSVDGFSQALAEDYGDQLDAQGQDYIRRVRAAAQRMAELIDDLLELSRVTRTELRRGTVDLSALARDIAAELQGGQPGRDVTFTIPDGLTAHGDARLIRVVLENLLGNAWKFSGNQPQACIELGACARDATPVYYVRDNGAGFDMQYYPRLFGPFQRLHTAAEFPGTGIGLATVQRVIQRHGGRVWAEGAVHQGATIYFTLP